MDTLKTAVANADTQFRKLRAIVTAEQSEASNAIAVKYKDQLNAAQKALADARLALQQYTNDTASHEWEGRKVACQVSASSSIWSREMKTQYGIVEVRRIGTNLPLNKSWGLPDLGAAFVRILKKDGTPGANIDCRYNGGISSGWKLCDD